MSRREQAECQSSARSDHLEAPDGALDDPLVSGQDADPPAGWPAAASPAPPAQYALPSRTIHELRTPLTSIHGYAQLLQRSSTGEPRSAKAVAIIARESVRLSEMLTLLSELSDLATGEALVPPADAEIGKIVGGVIQEATRKDAGHHTFVLQGTATASCNSLLLGQALPHLLTNAVRYSPEGTAIVVTVEEQGDRVIISVQDAGIGISAGDAARVYGAFERGANAAQAGVRGLGLGLHLARHLIGRLGGQLTHESVPAGGTRFCIELPSH